jgi:hypothetical protein
VPAVLDSLLSEQSLKSVRIGSSPLRKLNHHALPLLLAGPGVTGGPSEVAKRLSKLAGVPVVEAVDQKDC